MLSIAENYSESFWESIVWEFCHNLQSTAVDEVVYTMCTDLYYHKIHVVWPPGFATTSVPWSKVESVVSIGHTKLALVLVRVRSACQNNLSEQPVKATCLSNLSEQPCQSDLSERSYQSDLSEQPCQTRVVLDWHIVLTTGLCMGLEWMHQCHGPIVVVYCVARGSVRWINVNDTMLVYLYGPGIGCYFSWSWQLHVGSM